MTVGSPSSGSETYAYSSGTNRLASLTNASGTRSISYDGRGNTASETRPGSVSVSTSYDGYGRLLTYARTGDPSQANAYNGLDDRVSVTSGSTTHSFVYDPSGRLIGEYDSSGAPVAETIWLSPEVTNDNQPFGGRDGIGGYAPLALVTGSGGSAAIYWVHGSHMGVPRVTTDSSGAAATPSGYTVLGFPGQTRTLADLYYNRYRDYDSSLGRYIQADPIGLGGGNNPYLYAGANPLKFMDPSGRASMALPLPGGGGGIGGAFVSVCMNPLMMPICFYDAWLLGKALGCFIAGLIPDIIIPDPAPGFATSGGNGGPTKRPPPPAPNAPPDSTWAASPGAPMGPGGPDDPDDWGNGNNKGPSNSTGPRPPDQIKDLSKLERQMEQRGWTYQQVEDAVEKGQRFPTVNNRTGGPATRYVNPDTGRSVVIDDSTGGIIHVGGDGFVY